MLVNVTTDDNQPKINPKEKPTITHSAPFTRSIHLLPSSLTLTSFATPFVPLTTHYIPYPPYGLGLPSVATCGSLPLGR